MRHLIAMTLLGIAKICAGVALMVDFRTVESETLKSMNRAMSGEPPAYAKKAIEAQVAKPTMLDWSERVKENWGGYL